MYELFGGNPFDLMAEVLRLAEQKRKSSHWYTPTLEADERCGKEARKECAFIVHLPLNYAGISRWQDCTAKCYHHHGL